MGPKLLLAAGAMVACVLTATGGGPPADSKKSAYGGLLQGGDWDGGDGRARKVPEAEGGGRNAEAVRQSERLLAIRVREQGADHWQTISEKWALDRLQRIGALPPVDRENFFNAVNGAGEAKRLQADGVFDKAESL